MSRALLHRSLIASGVCPWCGPVYLGSCEGEPQEPHAIPIEQQTAQPVIPLPAPMRFRCEHLPAPTHWRRIGEAHRWTTTGPLEIRPVLALHVEVTAR